MTMIALLPGDGVGPEVTRQARIALVAIAQKYGHDFRFIKAAIGGDAIDSFGVPLPDATLDLCRNADGIMLGAVGGPKWEDIPVALRPEQGLLALRRKLGLFANIRPVKAPEIPWPLSPIKPEVLAGTDIVFVRELTGGIYFGEKKLEPVAGCANGGERASDSSTYTTEEITSVVRVAARIALERRGLVTSVDKANVLETSRLWRRVATAVMRDEFPEVQLEHRLVDSFSMDVILRPSAFDVVVTENMFGDILTDEASVLAGSIGMLASASLGHPGVNGKQLGMYEPIHGSAPSIAGCDVANPMGAILSAAMLLRYSLEMHEEAACIEAAVETVCSSGYVTPDLAQPDQPAFHTSDVGQAVARAIADADLHASAAHFERLSLGC
jgi:3-isopropylmalate dehydrogenase